MFCVRCAKWETWMNFLLKNYSHSHKTQNSMSCAHWESPHSTVSSEAIRKSRLNQERIFYFGGLFATTKLCVFILWRESVAFSLRRNIERSRRPKIFHQKVAWNIFQFSKSATALQLIIVLTFCWCFITRKRRNVRKQTNWLLNIISISDGHGFTEEVRMNVAS